MRTDASARVRDYVERLAVPAPDLDAVIAAAGRSARRRPGPGPARGWLVPMLAAAAVVAVVFSIGIAPALPESAGRPDTGRPSLPDRIAGYSYWTQPVSSDPPGRAIALYQQGLGVELFDFPQALVLGADGDTFRRVDVAEARSAEGDQGDPAPMRLSPDGTRVVVGTHGAAGDLAVVDLLTGGVTRLPARADASVIPLAFSPDGRSVVARDQGGQTTPFGGSPNAGALVRFDLVTGNVTRYPGLTQVTAAAFAPDGRELAVQNGSSLLVVDPATGAVRRTLAERGPPLRSPAAWSPDADLIAVGPGVSRGIAFVDTSGRGRATPAPVDDVEDPLGWTGPRTLIVKRGGTLVAVAVDDGTTRVLSVIDAGSSSNFKVDEIYLATGLLDGLTIRSAAWWPDRGGWPVWAIIAAAWPTGAALALLVVTIRRLRRPSRRRPPDPGRAHSLRDHASGLRWPSR